MTSHIKKANAKQPKQGSADQSDNRAKDCDVPNSIVCKANDYGNMMLPEMYEMWKKGLFCDVKFMVDSQAFFCHSLVIAAVSDFFDRLLKQVKRRKGRQEGNRMDKRVIRIRNIREEIFADIVQYAYTGTITLNKDNVFKLIFAGHYFEMTSLVLICCNFASTLVYLGNCFEVLDFARQQDIPCLYNKTIEFLEQSQDMIFSNPEVCNNRMESSMAFFTDRTVMIKRNGLPITPQRREEYFMKFLITSLDKSPELQDEFADYLKLVNLPLLPNSRWTQMFVSQRYLLDNALVEHLLKSAQLFRNGEVHSDIPAIWKLVPDPNWSLSTSEPMKHPKIMDSLPLKSAFNDGSEIEPDVAVTSIEFHFVEVMKLPHLAGIKSIYSDGQIIQHGQCISSSSQPKQFMSVETAILEDGELIMSVCVFHNGSINAISLHTTKGRQLGPFGYKLPCPSRAFIHTRYNAPIPGTYSHLHGFGGRVVFCIEQTMILNLTAVWASCCELNSRNDSTAQGD
ncbi:kelch-like protein 8 [Argopecten irradians]|uniref:kelch-like protein 8 n=1 Tax=Argopecten irradians TaxID=31199 RepID=UPI00371BC7F6